MDQSQDYVIHSLEQHLIFARIMKEHALFLKLGFLPPNQNLAQDAEHFLREFEALLSRAIAFSNRVVRNCVLCSGELVTEFTDCAERQTQQLTGTAIDRKLTSRTIELVGCGSKADPPVSQALVRQVRQLNRDGIQLVDGLIAFKERLLRSVCSCSLFTSNYPLLIEHILREARLYRAHLMRLENRSNCSRQELCDSELFWNRIMMEHALFIRSLLDPSEEALVGSAGDFAADYKRLLEASAAANDKVMNGSSLALTQKFRDFKRASVDGIASCKIRSIILPLLADHVLREANHYLRLLES